MQQEHTLARQRREQSHRFTAIFRDTLYKRADDMRVRVGAKTMNHFFAAIAAEIDFETAERLFKQAVANRSVVTPRSKESFEKLKKMLDRLSPAEREALLRETGTVEKV